MKERKKIFIPLFVMLFAFMMLVTNIPTLNAESETITLEYTVAPQSTMQNNEMAIEVIPKNEEQISIELLLSNDSYITNVILNIEDYQSSNTFEETLEFPTLYATSILLQGADTTIYVTFGLDGKGFLGHYADIGEGSYITLSFDVEIVNESNYIDVTFMVDGELYSTAKQMKNDTWVVDELQASMYRAGYRFRGWYLDPEYTTLDNEGSEVDYTVYGYFEEKEKILVRFYDGDTVISQSYQYESEPLLKPNPTKASHVFMGWYLDPEFETRLEDEAMFDDDINIYAKFNQSGGGGAIVPDEPFNLNFYVYIVGAVILIIVIMSFGSTKKAIKKKRRR